MIIKCLIALFPLTILLIGSRASDAAVRIIDDPGGQIKTYITRYEDVRASGERVIIDGYCASACTIVLGAIASDKICVTPRAQLGFHAAFDPGPHGRKIANPEATQLLYSTYPPKVQHWIDQRGGLSERMIFLHGHDLAVMYRQCRTDPDGVSSGSAFSPAANLRPSNNLDPRLQ